MIIDCGIFKLSLSFQFLRIPIWQKSKKWVLKNLPREFSIFAIVWSFTYVLDTAYMVKTLTNTSYIMPSLLNSVYLSSNFKVSVFLSKADFSFALVTVTFEPLELEQSYIHHLKALMCGINASRGQGHGCRFTMCHASLKMALLLHTEGLLILKWPPLYDVRP